MAMKALFDQSPFPPLQLSRDERRRFEKLAGDILRNVLSEYDHFGAPPHRRVLSKNRYKVVKSHENCTVYMDRHARAKSSSRDFNNPSNSKNSSTSSNNNYEYGLSHATTTAARSGSNSASSDTSSAPLDDIDADEEGANWKMPELVVSGTVPGTLEDVLYGMDTHDSADMMLRTAYVDDSWLDAAVLHQIQLPTPEDPFRFLGIKWYIKGIPMQYQSVVRPRDFVFLEASGIHTREDGTRVGYFLRHPVDLPTCGELTRHSVTRGRFTSYSIYTPLADTHSVDIFVRGKAEPNGKMTQSIAIMLTANSLLSSSNAVICSQSKKLTWLLRNAAAKKEESNRGPHSTSHKRTAATNCSVCTRKFGKLSTVATCSICEKSMCSRCRVARTLSYVAKRTRHAGFSVDQVSGVFCKTCITQANATSAMEVARLEVLSGRYGPVSEAIAVDTRAQGRSTSKSSATEPAADTGNSLADSAGSSEASSNEKDDDEVAGEPVGGLRDDWVPAIPYNVPVKENQQQQQQLSIPADLDDDPNLARQELWRKMAELRLQAESVYQLTKKTSDLHLTGSGSAEHYDSDTDVLD